MAEFFPTELEGDRHRSPPATMPISGHQLVEKPSLNFDLQTLTSAGEEAGWKIKNLKVCGTKNAFLSPLSFPEPQTRDMSHFLDSAKDVPMLCLIPTCSEIFGGVACTMSNEEIPEEIPKEFSGKDIVKLESTATGENGDEVKVQSPELHFGPKDEWLRHLLLSHKMVIDKVNEIGSLKR